MTVVILQWNNERIDLNYTTVENLRKIVLLQEQDKKFYIETIKWKDNKIVKIILKEI